MGLPTWKAKYTSLLPSLSVVANYENVSTNSGEVFSSIWLSGLPDFTLRRIVLLRWKAQFSRRETIINMKCLQASPFYLFHNLWKYAVYFLVELSGKRDPNEEKKKRRRRKKDDGDEGEVEMESEDDEDDEDGGEKKDKAGYLTFFRQIFFPYSFFHNPPISIYYEY